MLMISFFETNLEWTDVSIFFMLAVLFNYNKDSINSIERDICVDNKINN